MVYLTRCVVSHLTQNNRRPLNKSGEANDLNYGEVVGRSALSHTNMLCGLFIHSGEKVVS